MLGDKTSCGNTTKFEVKFTLSAAKSATKSAQ